MNKKDLTDERLSSLERSIDALDKKLTKSMSKGFLIRNLLMNALSNALGATIGIAIVALILNLIIKYFNIPIIEDLAKEIVKHLPKNY